MSYNAEHSGSVKAPSFTLGLSGSTIVGFFFFVVFHERGVTRCDYAFL